MSAFRGGGGGEPAGLGWAGGRGKKGVIGGGVLELLFLCIDAVGVEGFEFVDPK